MNTSHSELVHGQVNVCVASCHGVWRPDVSRHFVDECLVNYVNTLHGGCARLVLVSDCHADRIQEKVLMFVVGVRVFTDNLTERYRQILFCRSTSFVCESVCRCLQCSGQVCLRSCLRVFVSFRVSVFRLFLLSVVS